jgi:hypothetical protein
MEQLSDAHVFVIPQDYSLRNSTLAAALFCCFVPFSKVTDNVQSEDSIIGAGNDQFDSCRPGVCQHVPDGPDDMSYGHA